MRLFSSTSADDEGTESSVSSLETLENKKRKRSVFVLAYKKGRKEGVSSSVLKHNTYRNENGNNEFQHFRQRNCTGKWKPEKSDIE